MSPARPVAASVLVVLGLSLFGAAPVEAAAAQGDPERGEAVFRANCAMCHGTDASGMMGMHPALRGAVQRLGEDGVEVTVRKGRATRPPMPAWEGRLSDQEIADVVAYVATLPPGPRNFGPEGMMDGNGHSMMHDDDAGVPGFFWAVFTVAVALAGVAVFVWVLRSRGRARRRPSGLARDELDRRYAGGELSRDEYLQRRRDLES